VASTPDHDAPAAEPVSITEREDGPGLAVTDHVERHRLELWSDDPVSPAPADPDGFRFPVDTAVAVRAAALTVPTVVQTYVRDPAGEMLAAVDEGETATADGGVHDVEICAPMKLYLRVEGPVSVAADGFRVRIEFDGERRVRVGGRTHHERPAGTVTTTGRPRDAMRAVSTFGSALKTTSPERSYPTLRGHPPLVELGDRPATPPGLSGPDTGVRLVLPADRRHVYVAAPLAYYLGATVVPADGGTPRLTTDEGLDVALDAPDYERAVRRALERSFLLDCVVRTEGYYTVDLHERRLVERRLSDAFDPAALYDRPLAARLEAYHALPFDAIADAVPDWGLATHVEPAPSHVRMLPFLADELAVINTPGAGTSEPAAAGSVPSRSRQSAATEAFFRADRPTAAAGPDPATSFTRGVAAGDDGDGDGPRFVRPTGGADALERAWVGAGTPVEATKALPEAYHNRLGRSPVEGDIDIAVVCNDRAMAAESNVVDETYGGADLPFDVTVHRGLTRARLRETLAADHELLHYVGHIDRRGFDCADGHLDADTLGTVGVDAFVLNACRSFEQGAALVRAGAIAGIVTLNDVINESAVRMGRNLARLLDCGFPLTGALDVAGTDNPAASQYTVVGDGTLTLARADGSTPNSPVVLDAEDDGDGYRMEFHAYPTNRITTGSMLRPYVEANDRHYLFSGHVDTFEMDADALRDFLALQTVPVRIDGELRWSDELDLAAL
jgi:hypothetical protein